MLYMPGIFGESLMDEMDEWMRDMDHEFFGKKNNPLYGHNTRNLMKTDVRENGDNYEVDVELPGFQKEDIQLSIENGYLNITASKGLDEEQTDKITGRIIRQERYAGSLSRSFYVGEEITEEDIKAKLEHGILSLQIPKKEIKKALPEKKFIAIEG